MKLDRFDRNGKRIKLGNILKNVYTKDEYEVVFMEDILAFGLMDKYEEFSYMSEWVPGEWEVLA